MTTAGDQTQKESRFFLFFSTPLVSICCILAAWLNKTILAHYFFGMAGDRSIYTMMSQNLIDGKGLSETIYFLHNPGNAAHMFNGASLAPLGSLLLAPLIAITGDAFTANIIFDVAGYFLFIMGIRFMLKKSGAPVPVLNISTLIVGFFLYPFQLQSAIKDAMAIGILCYALGMILHRYNKKNENGETFLKSFFTGLLFIVPGILKLTFIPLAFPLFVLYFIAIRHSRKKELIGNQLGFRRVTKEFYPAVLAVIISGVIYVGWFFLQPYEPIPATWMPAQTNTIRYGLFPSQLSKTYPFIPAAFMNLEVTASIIQSLSGMRWGSIDILFKILNAAGFVIILSLAGLLLKNKLNGFDFFRLAAIALNLTLILVPAYLSLTRDTITYPDGQKWTYVSESRTFMLPLILLQVTVTWLFFKRTKTRLYKFIIVPLFILMSLFSLHSLYYSIKIASNYKANRAENLKEHVIEQVVLWIETDAAKNKAKIPVVSSNDHVRWLAALEGFEGYSAYGADSIQPTFGFYRVADITEQKLLENTKGYTLLKSFDYFFIYLYRIEGSVKDFRMGEREDE